MVLRLRPDRKEEKVRVREDLLRAALRLGAAHGFASLGLREVAREADIAPTSFYRHFEDMESLGLHLIRDKVEPLVREWAEAIARSDEEPVELIAVDHRRNTDGRSWPRPPNDVNREP